MKLHDYLERYMKTMGIIKKYFLRKNLKKSPGFWVSMAAVLALGVAFQNCGGQLKLSGQLLPSQLIHSADGQLAQGCTLAGNISMFNPYPPGADHPDTFAIGELFPYQPPGSGPRLLAGQAFGYQTIDVSNRTNPQSLSFEDYRISPY